MSKYNNLQCQNYLHQHKFQMSMGTLPSLPSHEQLPVLLDGECEHISVLGCEVVSRKALEGVESEAEHLYMSWKKQGEERSPMHTIQLLMKQ